MMSRPSFCKLRALDERVDVVLEPSVGGAERAIVRVVTKVGNDEGVVWQIRGRQFHGKLGEGYEILRLSGIVLHIREVSERIVAHGIVTGISSGIAGAREVLRIGFPSFAGGQQLTNDIVVDGKDSGVKESIIVRVFPAVSSK